MVSTFYHPLIFNTIQILLQGMYILWYSLYLDIFIQRYQASQVLRQVPVTPIQQHFSSCVSISSSRSENLPLIPPLFLTPPKFFNLSLSRFHFQRHCSTSFCTERFIQPARKKKSWAPKKYCMPWVFLLGWYCCWRLTWFWLHAARGATLFSPYLAVLQIPVFVPHGVKIAHAWHVTESHLRIFWFLEGWGWWGVCPRMEYQECTGLLGGCLSNSQPLRSARWVFGWIQHFSWHPLNPYARQSQVLSLLTRRS